MLLRFFSSYLFFSLVLFPFSRLFFFFSFPFPLASYHGLSVSWVGLGWSIAPAAGLTGYLMDEGKARQGMGRTSYTWACMEWHFSRFLISLWLWLDSGSVHILACSLARWLCTCTIHSSRYYCLPACLPAWMDGWIGGGIQGGLGAPCSTGRLAVVFRHALGHGRCCLGDLLCFGV